MNKELQTGFEPKKYLEQYEEQKKNIPTLIKNYNESKRLLVNQSLFNAGYADGLNNILLANTTEEDALTRLKMSAWRFTYDTLNISKFAPQTHISSFQNDILNNKQCPEYNRENLISIFGEYLANPRQIALQAFAEIFNSLDPFYKSHDNFAVGVKGLPKRIIIATYEYSYTAWDRVADVINVIARHQLKPHMVIDSYRLKDLCKSSSPTHNDLVFKYYKNGNVHIIFSKEQLLLINNCLAEYYGKVLPDAYEHTEKPSESKEVSKDLQFYETPKLAVDKLVEYQIDENDCILEPSCGEGAIMSGIGREAKRKGLNNLYLYGVEFNAKRAEITRNKGFNVTVANFLTLTTKQKFNKIFMNPPFYGKHYIKHIDKAYSLLEDNGMLRVILPYSAISHGTLEKYHYSKTELPLGSFKDSGTNINTMIVTIYKS